jgi:hypothetical protein
MGFVVMPLLHKYEKGAGPPLTLALMVPVEKPPHRGLAVWSVTFSCANAVVDITKIKRRDSNFFCCILSLGEVKKQPVFGNFFFMDLKLIC